MKVRFPFAICTGIFMVIISYFMIDALPVDANFRYLISNIVACFGFILIGFSTELKNREGK